jgi:VanZ family protein
MTDEFIQYFTPGRAMMVEDILLDLAGVATLLLIALITSLIKHKKRDF